jgi:hypothetical protein
MISMAQEAEQMKALYFSLLCVSLASSSIAYGDAIISGSVSSNNFSGDQCSSSVSAAASTSLHCSTVSGDAASLAATLGLTSGNVQVNLQSMHLNPGTTIDQASFDVSITGTYLLLGGTGSGSVNWSTSANGSLAPAPFWSNFGPCSITLAGVTENCSLLGGDNFGSFLVPYNTPLQLSFSTSFLAGVSSGDSESGTLTYNFGNLSPSPVPEPSSLLMVALGLFSIPVAVRLARSRSYN